MNNTSIALRTLMNLPSNTMLGFEIVAFLAICRQIFQLLRQFSVFKTGPADQVLFASSFWIRDTDDGVDFRLCLASACLLLDGAQVDRTCSCRFPFNVILALLNFRRDIAFFTPASLASAFFARVKCTSCSFLRQNCVQKYSQCIFQGKASFSFFLLSSTRLRAQPQAFITLVRDLSKRLAICHHRAKKKKKVSTFIARFVSRRKMRRRRAIQNSA